MPAQNDSVEADGEFADVLEAAQDGDPSACAQLWRRYAPAVAAYARARGSQDPDDLTSEVFLAVFRQLPRFAGDEDSFRGFVFTVAHRRLVDEYRARTRHAPTVIWTEEADHRRQVSAEEAVLEHSGAQEALRMLEALAPDQRDVLVLRIFGDLTVDQVASVLGKKVGAVKALQRRGLDALRRNVERTRTPTGLENDGRQ
jgi:RNA polymerase sigma-70 factor (ECF subfamily)